MASAKTLNAQQALLSLERSSLPVEEQLNEAIQILGSSKKELLNSTVSDEDIVDRYRSNAFSPKEEWILRWLLKRIRSTFDKESKYSLSQNTWLLLNQVVTVIPPKSLGRLLKEAEFPSVLDVALTEIFVSHKISSRWLELFKEVSNHQSISPDPSGIPFPPKRSLKRKRSKPTEDLKGNGFATETTVSNDLEPIFRPIFCVLYKCTTLAANPRLDDTTLGQHVRTAMGGRPEQLAALIAKALVVTEIVTQRSDAASQSWLKWLQSILNMWSFRSDQSNESIESESNVAFVRHLLIPTLAFIRRARVSGSNDVYTDAVKTVLERFVALHVVLPLRSALQKAMSNIKTPSPSDHNTSSKIIIEFISPSVQQSPFQTQDADMKSCLSSHSSTLLETAVRSVPRNSLHIRRQENIWLHQLFSALSQVVGYPVTGSDIDLPKTQPNIRDLEQLLEMMCRFNVDVEDTILKEIVYRYSGIQGTQHPEWSLLGKIIKLDPMVFITTERGESSNHLLNLLTENLSSISGANASTGDITLDQINRMIICPLIEAFGRSRDLPMFIDLWRGQLTSTFDHGFESRHSGRSLWLDRVIVDTFIQNAENNLPIRVMKACLESAVQSIEDPNVTLAQLCAEVVIVDAILLAITTDLQSHSLNLLHLTQAVGQSILANASRKHYTWRAFRFLHHTYSVMNYHNQSSKEVEPPKELLKFTRKTVVKGFQDQDLKGSDALMTSFEAFNFLVVSGCLFGPDKKRDVVKVIEALTSSLNLSVSKDGQNWSWDGLSHTMSTHQQLEWACLGTILRFPSLLITASNSTKALVEALLAAAEAVDRSSSGDINVFADYLLCLAADGRLNKHQTWSILMWNIMSDSIKTSNTMSPLIADILLKIPLAPVPRRQKAEMVDLIVTMIDQSQPTARSIRAQCLAVVQRILETADSSAKILSDEQPLLSLAMKCDASSDIEAGILNGLVILILNRKLVSIDSKGSQDYLNSLMKTCLKYLKDLKALDYENGRFHLIKEVAAELSRVEDRLGPSLRDPTQALQQRFFSILLSDLRVLAQTKKDLSEPRRVRQLYLILESLNTGHSFVPPSDLVPSLDQIVQRCKQKDDDTSRELLLRTELAKLRLTRKSDNTSEPTDMESVLLCISKYIQDLGPMSQISFAGFNKSISALDSLVSNTDPSSLIRTWTTLSTSQLSDELRQTHLLLTTIIASMPWTEVEGYSAAMTEALHQITTSLKSVINPPTFVLIAECIMAILQHQPAAVNQYNFDHILSSIAIAASPHGPQISNPSSKPVIFSRLCRILSMLLSRYRKKLGGRWHLLIPALQNLLTCLFTAPKPRTFPPPKDDFWLTNLPPWITTYSGPLTSTQTQHFTRLLLTLSDPTPSSVRRHHHSSLSTSTLTDETALARRTAGTFLTYFIAHYCHLQIQGGTMAQETKAALMPGIWATLDSMSIEGMRVMNAQMPGASERGVWKELYGEWKRVAKWTGD